MMVDIPGIDRLTNAGQLLSRYHCLAFDRDLEPQCSIKREINRIGFSKIHIENTIRYIDAVLIFAPQ